MDSQAQAHEVGVKLNEWLEKRKYRTLTTFTSRASGTWRITYDFLDPAHVDAIFLSPPVIGGRTYYPTRPRFIIPTYGYQIAILGCRDWQSAKATLDQFIRQLCRREDAFDPLVHSRMELGGDVYTAVLHDWDSTLKVAESGPALETFLSRHVLGRHISPVPQPGLLYCLNGSGLFLRQGTADRERSSLELQQLRHELDAVRQQGLEQIRTLYSTLALTNEAITAMNTRLDHSLAAMTNLAAQHALDAQANQLEFSIADLRREHDQCQLILVLGDRVPEEMRQHSLRRMRECEEQLNERRQRVMELRKRMAVLGPQTPTPGEPSLPPPPTHSPMPVSAVPPAETGGPPGTAIPRDLNMDTAPVSSPSRMTPWPDSERRMPAGARTEHRWPSARSAPESGTRTSTVHLHPTFRLPPTRAASAPCLVRPSKTPLALVLLFLLYFSSLFSYAGAANTLSALTLNCNGLANAAKQNTISALIASRQPHVWVLNETKSPHPMSDRIHAPGYNKYESPGRKLDRGRGGKWGVIVGVKSNLHAQRLDIDARFCGRIVALDIVISTTHGRGYLHRFFWQYVAGLCCSAPHSWSILGDCNTTLLPFESLARTFNSVNRLAYSEFLRAADGIDVWASQGDSTVHHAYTCKSSNGLGLSVIDRVAVSRLGVASLQSAERPSYPPRFRYPKHQEKYRFSHFASLVDSAIAAERLHDHPVVDDESFDRRYLALTRIFRSCGLEAFETPRTAQSATPPPKPMNSRIRAILTETRRVNRLIFAVKHGSVDRLARDHLWAQRLIADFTHSAPLTDRAVPPSDLLLYLQRLRRTLGRLRYLSERAEAERRVTQVSRARINAALLGGSCKHLYTHSLDSDGPPAALQSPDDPSILVTDAGGIKEATVRYFSSLFARTPRTPSQKPWMTTPSIARIRERTAVAPFAWPRLLTPADLRTLLRKGNPRPSPGPDLWEKWCIKALSDSALSLVLDLVNYEIEHSHFPDSVKPAIMSTIFKRGARTDLANYRGITSDAYAHRRKQPLLVLRRDQRKGFDRLEPDGFYDAVQAYGLPRALIDLDRSAQDRVP
ncbi:hypothetical protein BV20DRAFT_945484, partial [Pilatotrama ljubarskyi]